MSTARRDDPHNIPLRLDAQLCTQCRNIFHQLELMFAPPAADSLPLIVRPFKQWYELETAASSGCVLCLALQKRIEATPICHIKPTFVLRAQRSTDYVSMYFDVGLNLLLGLDVFVQVVTSMDVKVGFICCTDADSRKQS